MEYGLAERVLASLPRGPVAFRYFKDRYALQLLAYAASEGRSLSEMRRGRFGPLLQKPEVRRLIGGTGRRGVDWSLLDTHFPKHTEHYRLTFGTWGSEDGSVWNQTTRPGHNVVVQLNFPSAHDRAYRRYIRPEYGDPFACDWHPINLQGDHTLAWARLDIDRETGEALIEEIQSDWIRFAAHAGEAALEDLLEGSPWVDHGGCDALQLFRYVEHVLSPHRRMWDEAVLAASLWVLREKLCIRRIYMHTHESGCRLKGIDGRPPPRSLYERIPRAFCFERVKRLPKFLQRAPLRARPGLWCEFWFLQI